MAEIRKVAFMKYLVGDPMSYTHEEYEEITKILESRPLTTGDLIDTKWGQLKIQKPHPDEEFSHFHWVLLKESEPFVGITLEGG